MASATDHSRTAGAQARTKPPYDEILTVAETCRFLKVAPRTLYRYLQESRVPAFKLGKEWRFVRSDLDRWIRQSVAGRQRRSARR